MRAVIFVLRTWARTGWRSWLALGLLIGVVGGIVLTTAAGARRTDTAYARLERSVNGADVLISPNGTGLTGYYDALGQAPDIIGMAKLALLNTGFQSHSLSSVSLRVGRHTLEDINLEAGLDDRMALAVGRPKLLGGRVFDPHRPDQALVDYELADRYGLHPGSTFRLVGVTVSSPMGDGGVVQMQQWVIHVTGVAVFDSRVVPITTADTKPFVVVTPAFAHRLDPSFFGADGAFLRLRPGTDMARVRGHVENLAASFPATGGSVAFSNLDDHQVAVARAIRPEAVALGLTGLVLGLIALAVIGQLLSRQTWLDAVQSPALRSFGASRRQLLALAGLRVGVVAFAGAVLAVVVAVLASPLMPIGPARLAEPAPGFEANLAVLLIALAGIPILLLLATAPAVWRSSAPLIEGTRRSELSSAQGASWVLPLPQVSATLGTRMALQSGSGPSSVPVRSALVGLSVATAALTAAVVFGASLDRLVGTPDRYGQRWSLAMESFGALPEYAVAPVASSIPGVDSYGGGTFGQLSIGGQVVPAVGVDRIRGDVFPTILQGRAPASPAEIAFGARTMRLLHVRIGDKVTVGIRASFRMMEVVGQVILPGLSRGSFNPTDLGDGAATVASVFAPPASVGHGLGYNLVFIGLRAGTNASLAAQRLTSALIAHGCPGPAQCPVTTEQQPGDIGNYSRIRTAPIFLALILGVLALATLAHVLITSIRRRRKDLAVLKTLGFVGRQISAAVAWQSSVLAAVTLVVGLPLGIALGRWMWATFAGSIGVAGDADVPILLVLIGVPVVFLAANVIAFVPGWTARRTQPALFLRGD